MLASGDVDLTFGTNGVATAEFYDSKTWGDTVRTTVLQADGKIITAGQGTAARYLSNGNLDTTFGVGGRTPLPLDAHAMVATLDGKLLLAGGSVDGISRDFVLARLTANGMLDSTFADQGQQRIDFGNDNESAYAMVRDSMGRVVVAGRSGNSVAVARVLADGMLDGSFSSDGLFTQQFSLKDTAYAVALQASGRIVVAGSSWISTATTPFFMANYDMFVMKLYPNGSLDRSFDGDGYVTTSFSEDHLSYDIASDIAIQVNGQIVITGQASNFGAMYVGTVRYNLNGTLDRTFDGDGKRMDWVGNTAEAAPAGGSVLARKDGSLLVTRADRVLQYTISGQLDTRFDSDGIVQLDGLSVMAIEQSDRKLIIGGKFDGQMGLRRYQPNGAVDSTFSNDGLVTLETGPSREIVHDSFVTPDGKTIVVGASRHAFAIARFDSQGRLDTTFSGDGKLLVSFGVRYFDAVARSVALAPDGRIVVGGYVKRMSGAVVESDFAVVRLLVNGALDTSFSGDGRQVTDLGGLDYGYAVSVLSDGRIVLVGEALNRRAAIVRYRANGLLDTDFSGDGITVMTRANSSLHNLSVLPDGRLLASGEIFITDLFYVRYKTALFITRFTADGQVDSTFGSSGVVVLSSPTIRNSVDMVVAPDGSFYVAGTNQTCRTSRTGQPWRWPGLMQTAVGTVPTWDHGMSRGHSGLTL